MLVYYGINTDNPQNLDPNLDSNPKTYCFGRNKCINVHSLCSHRGKFSKKNGKKGFLKLTLSGHINNTVD